MYLLFSYGYFYLPKNLRFKKEISASPAANPKECLIFVENVHKNGMIMKLMRKCEVYVNGVKAGILEETKQGYMFTYDKLYLLEFHNPPISLTMPLRKQPYCSKYLFPFFFNMLSEGENREMQSQLLHIDPEDDFGILLATAQYDTIGSVTVKPV